MKRLLSFVLLVLLVTVSTTTYAQQNIFVLKNSGDVSVKSVADIDSITFDASSGIFNIRTTSASTVTENTLKASFIVSLVNGVKSLSQTPEVGVCYSSTNANPTYADEYKRFGILVADHYFTLANYDFTLYELDSGTNYYYRAYVKLGDEVFYGNVKSVMTFGDKPTASKYVLINGHKFIDLGLRSGLLWAHTNVGANYSSDAGDYFAWGETYSKSCYSKETYSLSSTSLKYSSSDGSMILYPEDDVATVKWGKGCRMPSILEFKELCEECTWVWQSNYQDACGYLVTGPNGNSIFFPMCGYYDSIDLQNGGEGYYWSRSLYADNKLFAYVFLINDRNIISTNYFDRHLGLSVRPVAEK